MLYRIRRKSDGMFFGAKDWGKTHSNNGKFYFTFGQARGAFKQGDLKPDEHEYVEYELNEIRRIDANLEGK